MTPKPQWEQIVDRLRLAGKNGVTTTEIFHGLFCCNYKARISDARRLGYVIECKPIPDSKQHRYWLVSEPSNVSFNEQGQGVMI